MVVEDRPYGPDSSSEEQAVLRGRVTVLAERLLLVHEIPVQTPFSIDLIQDRIDELAEGWLRFGYVLDLIDAHRPGPEVRAELKRRVAMRRDRVSHVAIAVGGNLVMRAMARLVAYGMGLEPVSLHDTREEALAEVRRVLAK